MSGEGMGAFGAGMALGLMQGTADAAAKSRGGLRQEVVDLNEKMGVQEANYKRLMAKYNALVHRFGEGRGDLLATAKAGKYYRKTAHDLSNLPYEEVDAHMRKIQAAGDERIEGEVEEARLNQRRLDREAGLDVWEDD